MGARTGGKLPEQQTHGDASPAAAIGTIGDVGAGATVRVGGDVHYHLPPAHATSGRGTHADFPLLFVRYFLRDQREFLEFTVAGLDTTVTAIAVGPLAWEGQTRRISLHSPVQVVHAQLPEERGFFLDGGGSFSDFLRSRIADDAVASVTVSYMDASGKQIFWRRFEPTRHGNDGNITWRASLVSLDPNNIAFPPDAQPVLDPSMPDLSIANGGDIGRSPSFEGVVVRNIADRQETFARAVHAHVQFSNSSGIPLRMKDPVWWAVWEGNHYEAKLHADISSMETKRMFSLPILFRSEATGEFFAVTRVPLEAPEAAYRLPYGDWYVYIRLATVNEELNWRRAFKVYLRPNSPTRWEVA